MAEKAADGKEENVMAFQGRQRIQYDVIQHHSVLTLMVFHCFIISPS